jgi:ribosomal protein S18 acetylase RimI-like enzyme
MRLIDVMAVWDVEMSKALGFSEQEIRSTFYNDTQDSLAEAYDTPDAMILLTRDEDRALGFIALRVDGPIGVIERYFVDPDARGRGVGGRILDAGITVLEERGVSCVRLMTATFMDAAHSLYRSRGFQLCKPFEDVGERLQPATLFMERRSNR